MDWKKLGKHSIRTVIVVFIVFLIEGLLNDFWSPIFIFVCAYIYGCIVVKEKWSLFL